MEQNVSALDKKHHQLEQAILQEEKRPYPDQFKISQLKRQKLRIKDQLAKTQTAH